MRDRVALRLDPTRCVGTVTERGITLTIAPLVPGLPTFFAPADTVLPAPAVKKDNVRIIGGELVGRTGLLLGIDGDDAIVKVDDTLDIKILQLRFCVPYVCATLETRH